MTASHSSSVIRSSSVSRVMPALATSTSTGPCSASTATNAASTSSASVTSHRIAEKTVGRLARPVGHRDPVALRREHLRGGKPDTAAAAGDEHRARHAGPSATRCGRVPASQRSRKRRGAEATGNGDKAPAAVRHQGYGARFRPSWRLRATARRDQLAGRSQRQSTQRWAAGASGGAEMSLRPDLRRRLSKPRSTRCRPATREKHMSTMTADALGLSARASSPTGSSSG